MTVQDAIEELKMLDPKLELVVDRYQTPIRRILRWNFEDLHNEGLADGNKAVIFTVDPWRKK